MFQSFTTTASPDHGAARLAALRVRMVEEGLDGFIVPRADAYQGEYVASCDERLSWLTGFTGSAGLCVVLADQAGVFIDGRYRTQVRTQVDLDVFTPVPWPETKPETWIAERTSGVIGYDPWLHTSDDIKKLEAAGVTLRPTDNLIDAIWKDRPAPPMGRAFAHPDHLAGRTSAEKRRDLASGTTVLTLPDSICWLLNIRGADVPRNPVLHAFAILHDDARVDLFADAAKFDAATLAHLGPDVTLRAPDTFMDLLRQAPAPVRIDPASAPVAIRLGLQDDVLMDDDPCRLPKARKNSVEIAATREAHLRDAAAMIEFLSWIDGQEGLTEIAVVKALEGFRRATNALHDISFDTICGAGPNGAIIHYRVTEETDRAIGPDELLLVDSGGQYVDGTTDITRTIPIGDPGPEARECYTRVLQGLIAMSRARWPKGLAGRDLDALARYPLWQAGMDYDHGTGHGVGAFLSVHEGPQRLSRLSDVPLARGMILSNEPGYYREGAFGIRLENLMVVEDAPRLADARDQLRFETLTLVPFDPRLIRADTLSGDERDWLVAYHRMVVERVGPRLSAGALDWLHSLVAQIEGWHR